MNPRVSLALRRARGDAVAAEALAERLAMTPDAVARAVDALEQAGFRIESHPIQGYRLLGVPRRLLEDELACDLGTRRIGRHVRCVEEAASTNDLAWLAADEGRDAADGLAVFAEYQTAGRGRRGRRWFAPPHSSILGSVVLWVPDAAANGGGLTRAVSLAAAEAIEGETGLEVGIRWPNDLVVDDRKIGGVLVEARSAAAGETAVVLGVGINCTQRAEAFPPRIRPGVASLETAGAEADRTLLARALLARLDAVLARLADASAVREVHAEAARRCRTLGRRITVTDGRETTSGEVVALDPEYGLLLRLADGAVRRFPPMTTHVVAQGEG
ncbi:MAG: biotin--[acetyl-CoA-carboxylase] ligase [Planctomycetes bacterium]|nr:biotin--[acetyl-CoA-carboxylase] ligase [Planctomycetota bacterium]